MFFSSPRLHPNLITTDEQRDLVRQKVQSLVSRRPKRDIKRAATDSRVPILLTTISQWGNFDSWIQVQFPNPAGAPIEVPPLLVNSGNTTMIIPNGEDLVGVPGYTVLGTATEPWGCPANVVQGTLRDSHARRQPLRDRELCVLCLHGEQLGRRANRELRRGAHIALERERMERALRGADDAEPAFLQHLLPLCGSRLRACRNDHLEHREVPGERWIDTDPARHRAVRVHDADHRPKPRMDVGRPRIVDGRRHGDGLAGKRLFAHRDGRYRRRSGLPERPQGLCLSEDLARYRRLSGVGVDVAGLQLRQRPIGAHSRRVSAAPSRTPTRSTPAPCRCRSRGSRR